MYYVIDENALDELPDYALRDLARDVGILLTDEDQDIEAIRLRLKRSAHQE